MNDDYFEEKYIRQPTTKDQQVDPTPPKGPGWKLMSVVFEGVAGEEAVCTWQRRMRDGKPVLLEG